MGLNVMSAIIGNIGVILFLGAYFLLPPGKIAHTSLWYSGLNLGGALLLMFSLWIDWNLSAFMLEAAWALISMWGIWKGMTR